MFKSFFNWLFVWNHEEEQEKKAAITLYEAWAYGYPVPESYCERIAAWNSRHGAIMPLADHISDPLESDIIELVAREILQNNRNRMLDLYEIHRTRHRRHDY